MSRIEKVYKRYNYFARYNPRIPSQSNVIAANIDHMLILTAYFPQLDPFLIDKYLITAESMNIPASILHNKIDLPVEDEHIKQDKYILDTYKSIGYKTFDLSIKQDINIDQFITHLKYDINNVNNNNEIPMVLLIGPSGVGKSATINKLMNTYINKDLYQIISNNQVFKTIPEQDINKLGRGRHTTTNIQSYPLTLSSNKHINIIDSPGISHYYIPNHILYDQLALYYPEFNQYYGHCKYRNCLHENEPDCSIKTATRQYLIDPRRYESYLTLLTELKQRIRY